MAMSANADIVINEVMQSNIDCTMDNQNEFPDSWVELWNNSTTPINLSNYKIGINGDASTAWQLPNQEIGPKRYLLIYCDKQATDLHTNFKLDTGKGGKVVLFKNNAMEDSLVNIPKMLAPNISYGRETDVANTIGYMLSATPGVANKGGISDKILGDPLFSKSGFINVNSGTFSLTLNVPEGTPEGAEIRYTTDGSVPTTTSTLYKSPISIRKSTCLRARLFYNGYHSPMPRTESYIFHNRSITLPVVSIVTNEKYFYDNKLGIYVDGTYNSSNKNYSYNWRRPINIEMYDVDGQSCILNQVCETRVAGAASRGAKLKSLAIYANKRFGTKHFDHEFFPDQKPGLHKFKSLLLRNAGNDFDYLYMRDAVIQRAVASSLDVDWQAWKPCIVYINGVYKGMLNLRERSNEDNIWTNYDGLEDIDMIENWYELKTGTIDSWNDFQSFYDSHDNTLADYDKVMDWSEFMDVMIANLYFNNADFPGNNIVFWRPQAEGGKWRCVMKDTDFGLGLYGSQPSYNTIEWIYNPSYDSDHAWANEYGHTRLFRRLMEIQDFKDQFIDRCAIYAYSTLGNKAVRNIWDPMYNTIKTEFPSHRALINPWWPVYNNELQSAQNWMTQRPDLFVKIVANYYKTGSPQSMIVNNNVDASILNDLDITMNGIPLKDGTYNGKFYLGRTVTLQAKPTTESLENGTYNIAKAWQLTTVENGKLVTREIPGDTYTFTMPTTTTFKINLITGAVAGIEEIEDGNSNATPMAYYDLSGRKVTSFQTGHIYIVKYADGTSRKVMK